MAADLEWRRSPFCADNQCVEVAVAPIGRGFRWPDGTTAVPGQLLYRVRDGKDPDGGVLLFTANEWEAFRRGVVAGGLGP